ncbi:H-2 class II histocompatibility antigen, A-B alpha chain-like isoform X2 [Betta splendens]|uniref:H-2 class II histocompatibility antigen, A-B alpha chain-like isoform X2 n=1 Tax=Betta splendens TaxID=158456 RepID=A0A9W2XBH5_BETSP|nr:H-2 class II histocompatibility antigen, A-B alpha chain-like isoform X2 [Betta splendens]
MSIPSVMTIGSSDMKRSAVIVLMLHACCGFSQISHELVYSMGCFVNGTTDAQFKFDNEEIYFVDFQNEKLIYTVPISIDPDPYPIWANLKLEDSLDNKKFCFFLTNEEAKYEENSPEERDPPEIMLFLSQELELGLENKLICFVNHFYPPSVDVRWTKNGHPVSEGVSLSRYYLNKDQTFHQFSTLTFTPSEGDIYSCTVEHSALETPKTRIWASLSSSCCCWS